MRIDEYRLLIEPQRFRFMLEVANAPSGGIHFTTLVNKFETSSAALSYHAWMLLDAGWVRGKYEQTKSVRRCKYSLTPAGRAALVELRSRLAFLDDEEVALAS